jgi:hypothetical protein
MVVTSVDQILDRAWSAYAEATRQVTATIQPSVPILWFGDLEAYERSSLKVITVGLNPSRGEFPTGDAFLRFPRARNTTSDPNSPRARADLVLSLNEYFRVTPYGWFDLGFGAVLDGLGASYREGSSIALHTDLCSPIATDPNWTGLTNDERAFLLAAGVTLWHELIRYLAPHLVVISIGRDYIRRICFERETPKVIYAVAHKQRYVVEASRIHIADGVESLMIFGRAAQLPFGLLSTEHKQAAGRAVLSYYSSMKW